MCSYLASNPEEALSASFRPVFGGPAAQGSDGSSGSIKVGPNSVTQTATAKQFLDQFLDRPSG
jgi:hypothetical protein